MPRSLLATGIDLHEWLERDQTRSVSERSHRDRNIGQALHEADEVSRVLAWWQVVDEPAGNNGLSRGQRVVAVRRWLSWSLFAAGLFVGGSICSVALAYDGRYPVNLLAFLGVMVALPAAMVVLTLGSMGLRVAGLGPAAGQLSTFNLNRWVMGLWDRLGGLPLSRGYGQADARGRFVYWQVLVFSQLFSVGFFIGAICMFGVLVAVTDLAFGWSTTLDLPANTVYGWFSAISSPWADGWPAASPDPGLVEASRFYRLESEVSADRAEQLGAWWPFVLMSLVVWGLTPRVLLLGISALRLRVATRVFVMGHSEVTALLDRMANPVLELGEVVVTEPADSSFEVDVGFLASTEGAAVIEWNDAAQGNALPDVRLQLRGGQRSKEWAELLEALPTGVSKVVVLVKSWEPPVLEFMDILGLVRQRVGRDTSIVVSPLGLAEDRFSASEVDEAVWSAAVAKLGDPRTYVARIDVAGIDAEALAADD